jgi:predicted cobalt transporter CbtA
MSSSTTAGTSRAHPATRAGGLGATAWLRVALLAGLAGALAAIVFDLLVAEGVVDRAVALEGAHADHPALALPEPFSRSGQRGGLVAGELLLGAGVALLLAGVATFLEPRARSPRRLWWLIAGACLWGVVVLPALVFPPLPPGVESALPLGERQALYVATIALGAGGFALATHVWSLRGPLRAPVALACIAVPAAVALWLFPAERAATSPASAVITDFRLVAIGSQLLFWSVLSLAGAVLLRRDGS